MKSKTIEMRGEVCINKLGRIPSLLENICKDTDQLLISLEHLENKLIPITHGAVDPVNTCNENPSGESTVVNALASHVEKLSIITKRIETLTKNIQL